MQHTRAGGTAVGNAICVNVGAGLGVHVAGARVAVPATVGLAGVMVLVPRATVATLLIACVAIGLAVQVRAANVAMGKTASVALDPALAVAVSFNTALAVTVIFPWGVVLYNAPNAVSARQDTTHNARNPMTMKSNVLRFILASFRTHGLEP